MPPAGLRRTCHTSSKKGLRYLLQGAGVREGIIVEQSHEHVWERLNRQGPCTCAQCLLPDPRGLECNACAASMKPGDEGFDEMYESAPWWWEGD